jgi:glycosyltransferase involved in cell wall biosynthesis
MTETDIRSQTAAVIPAYQDEKHIGEIARRTRERLNHVVVVDDGSTDQTEQRAREVGAEVIVHAQNQGKGEAIKTGLAHWLGPANPSGSGQDREIKWVILLDSDGQHLPEEIDRFLLAAASVTRPTFFIGNRMGDVARMPFLRRVVNRYMSHQISRVCGQIIPDTQCGYRMLHRELAPDMLGGGHRFDYDTEALIIASRKGLDLKVVTTYAKELVETLAEKHNLTSSAANRPCSRPSRKSSKARNLCPPEDLESGQPTGESEQLQKASNKS